ncbi:hypothetical protein [Bradyrhizobium sp. ARR65]|uniref:hypothetical protein n=1 Tax=Bradyrhizobium sp. ARR65 TaxID=1040989 RepID=UPI000AA668BF|nr:hypothetical protein [Bradyrhizobium sp. ARR65]
MVAFGAPMMMATFLFYLGVAATIPFISGLLGFSRRAPFLMTAVLTGGFICLGAVAFSDDLKYQDVYSLLLLRIEATALFGIELLIAFVLAHWLGAQSRAGILRVRNRSP